MGIPTLLSPLMPIFFFDTTMLRFGQAPFLECSSRGEKRFSAFYARIRGRGNKSIEDLYQSAKKFEDPHAQYWTLRDRKGKPAKNQAEVRELYSTLWDEYIEENPEFIEILLNASGLSDIFGQKGHACQAEELWRIREKYRLAREC